MLLLPVLLRLTTSYSSWYVVVRHIIGPRVGSPLIRVPAPYPNSKIRGCGWREGIPVQHQLPETSIMVGKLFRVEGSLVAEFISPPKVYTFSFIVGNIVPPKV